MTKERGEIALEAYYEARGLSYNPVWPHASENERRVFASVEEAVLASASLPPALDPKRVLSHDMAIERIKAHLLAGDYGGAKEIADRNGINLSLGRIISIPDGGRGAVACIDGEFLKIPPVKSWSVVGKDAEPITPSPGDPVRAALEKALSVLEWQTTQTMTCGDPGYECPMQDINNPDDDHLLARQALRAALAHPQQGGERDGWKLTETQFIVQIALHIMKAGNLSAAEGLPKASAAYSDFLVQNSIAFGDPAYAWDEAAAVIVGREYETDHWDAPTSPSKSSGEEA